MVTRGGSTPPLGTKRPPRRYHPLHFGNSEQPLERIFYVQSHHSE
nr:MAG TPA: hypothetical protein [Caudoviricetes sp.]